MFYDSELFAFFFVQLESQLHDYDRHISVNCCELLLLVVLFFSRNKFLR